MQTSPSRKGTLLGGLIAGCLAAVIGCSDPATESLEIPEDNPYQQTPEEIAAYNAAGTAAADEARMTSKAKK